MLEFYDIFSEIYTNIEIDQRSYLYDPQKDRCGKLLDPVSEIFFARKDMEEELWWEMVRSGQYIELPINNAEFRHSCYEEFVNEYLLKHYKNDPQIKHLMKILQRCGDDYSRYEGNLTFFLGGHTNEAYGRADIWDTMFEKVKKWCDSNNILYYETSKRKKQTGKNYIVKPYRPKGE